MMGRRWADLTKARREHHRPGRIDGSSRYRSAHDEKVLAQRGASIDEKVLAQRGASIDEKGHAGSGDAGAAGAGGGSVQWRAVRVPRSSRQFVEAGLA